MKVSVILPIYNGETTLFRTLQSLWTQTFIDFELIACIDGTNDGSEKILLENASRFKHLKILKNKANLGLGATLNRLVANTNGTYLAIAEQDDYYYNYRLQKQVEFLEKNQDYGLVSGIAEFFDGNEVVKKFPDLLLKNKAYPQGENLFLLNYIYQTKIVNSCAMIRKSVHINNGLYFSSHYPNIPVDLAYFLRFSLISKVHGLHVTLVKMDRSLHRKSVTTLKHNHYKAHRELLRSFKFEFPNIVSQDVYNKAITKQVEIELRANYGVIFLKKFICVTLRYPFKCFPYKVLKERFKAKINRL